VARLGLVVAEVECVVCAGLLVVDVAGVGALLPLELLHENEVAALRDVEHAPVDDVGRRLGYERLGGRCWIGC
jgi:hypothetical protein